MKQYKLHERRVRFAATIASAIVIVSLAASPAQAWFDPAWPMRRNLELTMDASRVDGDETAVAEFYAPGLAKPDGSDLRIATDDDKLVPMRLLRGGKDDRVMVAFNPIKGKTKYHAYWGNAGDKLKPPAEAIITAGLLVEMKRLPAGPAENAEQVQKLWEKGGDIIGRAMIERPFIGYNPAGLAESTISRITGVIYAPVDGEYQVAVSADDRGTLKLDGADLVFARGFPEDIRFNAKKTLKRGAHAVEYFHIDHGGDWRLTIGWRRPDMQNVSPIDADSFGRTATVRNGPLEQLKKEVVADLLLSRVGECFVAEKSSYRVRMEVPLPEKTKDPKVTWDFGDGQTGTGVKVDHVYLSAGVYPVVVTLKLPQGEDKRTYRIDIGRDPNRVVDPALDEPGHQSDVLARYDPAKLPAHQHAMLVRLLARSKKIDAMLPALAVMCGTTKHPDQQWAVDAIEEAIEAAVNAKRLEDLAGALAKLSPDSNLHPKAADLHADVLLWRLADFKQASAMLAKFADKDSKNLKRLLMQAMLLNGQVDEANKVLATLPQEAEVGRRVALSGALARSVEYYIDNGEFEDAAKTWDDWQRRFPDSFFEGYSALLKVRMMEKAYPVPAAKVAEAFAIAVPGSPYAPQLLDRASNILAKHDKGKSDTLRKLLKEKYPEDPLSQDRLK